MPRFRFRVRTQLILVALVALGLVGVRVYREGVETHWQIFKLRFGNAATRRLTAEEIEKSVWMEGQAAFLDDCLNGTKDPQVQHQRVKRREKRAGLLLPVVLQATKDADPGCRASAIKALNVVGWDSGSDVELNDPEASMRATAIDAFRKALDDPSIEVRVAAADSLARIGLFDETLRHEVAAILIPLLASKERPRVRVIAGRGLNWLGNDRRRKPGDRVPDVVPALVAALGDPEVEVRKAVAHWFCSKKPIGRPPSSSDWLQRKDAIIPALVKAMSDPDATVREDAAMALWILGERRPASFGLLLQAARDSETPRRYEFNAAVKDWGEEIGWGIWMP